MPGPPPPPQPPLAPPPPVPSGFSLSPNSSEKENDRSALLKSIRQGKKLKKTITVDKSAPMISEKSNNNVSSLGVNNDSSRQVPQQLSLGGLFIGGMPKLKSTGRLGTPGSKASPNSDHNDNNNDSSCGVPIAPIAKNFLTVQDQLKKQLNNSSNNETIKSRGPPPPAPLRNLSIEESKKISKLELASISAQMQSKNNSALHRKSKSNANLNSYLDSTETNSINAAIINNNSKPVISHGKPNLAPKPPVVNGKATTTIMTSASTPGTGKLSQFKSNKTIYRAQSMRNPRTPSPSSSQNDSELSLNNVEEHAIKAIKFGTVRNVSHLIGHSLGNINISSSSIQMGGSHIIHQRNGSRPQLATRPSVPPPSIPTSAVPPSSTINNISSSTNHSNGNKMKPPNHAPPPPPPQPAAGTGLNQLLPPPPPPHKIQIVGNFASYNRPSPAVSNNNQHLPSPPPPPPRNSSMRATPTADFDEKFKNMFGNPDKFPRPPPFRNVLKVYSNRQGNNSTAIKINKQQAPPPPSSTSQFNQSANSAMWNLSTTTY